MAVRLLRRTTGTRFGGGALIVTIALWAGMGCSRSEPTGGKDKGPSFTEKEAERGRKACQSFADRVCACAKAKPDDAKLASDCELAKGRPEALELALRAVHASQNREPEDRWAIDQNARQIIQKCIEADLKLDPGTCPRQGHVPTP